MAREIFLARTEEQERFRQVLRTQYKSLWQILQEPVPGFSKPVENDLPFILLFYGEGGMGKTRLIHRLQEITEGEKEFKGKFNILFLDWEDKKKLNIGLQVGHDNIQPETMLRVLHEVLDARGWGKSFDEYRKLVKQLKEIEDKVDRELKKPELNSELQAQVRKLGVEGISLGIRQQFSF